MKLAPVFHEAEKHSAIDQVVVHTGQHYDDALFGRFLTEFDLPQPDYDLAVGSKGQVEQIGHMLIRLEEVFDLTKPDVVFVYGDTNSTAAGAIAGAKSNIPVAHIEAGLREWDKSIPEEVNKLLIDAVSDLFFCPTDTGVQNLMRSGILRNIHNVGDVVVDLIRSRKMHDQRGDRRYALVTCHRAVNTISPARLQAILRAISRLDIDVVFPMHPRTRNAINGHGLEEYLDSPNISVVEPMGFWELQQHVFSADLVLTDSGGVIREAYVHRTPCVILDDQTEWVESVEEGWSTIAGANEDRILQSAIKMTGYSGPQTDFLGNGTAARQIIDITMRYLRDESLSNN